MSKVLLRNRGTGKTFPIDREVWERVKANYSRIFVEVGTIDTPAEIIELRKAKAATIS